MNLVLDKFGRMVLPRALRREFGLQAGDSLSAARQGETILLRPVSRGDSLRREDGVLVFTGTATADIADAVAGHREDRLARAAAWEKPS